MQNISQEKVNANSNKSVQDDGWWQPLLERFELGSDDLRQSGVRDIAANPNSGISVTTRANATSFDALQILLGFSDNKDGRALVAELSLAGFDGVRISPIPAVLPDGRNFSVEVSER